MRLVVQKFNIDKAQDESKRKQMTLVIEFVYRSEFIQEWFLDIMHVKDTIVLTLKVEISYASSHHNLDI
jgi:hypothetical protein